MSKEAMKLALEALEMFCEYGAILKPIETRDAIKEALANHIPDATKMVAQQSNEQVEPVAWLRQDELDDLRTCNYRHLGADSPSIWAPNAPDAPSPDMKLVAVYTIPRQPKEPEQRSVSEHLEPVAWMVTSEMQDGTKNTYPLTGRFKDVKDVCDFGNPVPLYTTPPQPENEVRGNLSRNPQFKEFIKWVEDQGHDAAHTYNPNTGKWICLNSMTADLWKAWEAAHGIKE